MPGSVRENDQFVKQFVLMHDLSTVLDVGAGKGTYADLLAPLGLVVDGIEVWPPYVKEFDLVNKYRSLTIEDARTAVPRIAKARRYDLVVFGDVLEHMTEEESLDLWKAAAKVAAYGLISVPVIHYPQGAEFGNPYEVHVQEHLTPEHVRATFGPFDYEAVYSVTGTFIKRFQE